MGCTFSYEGPESFQNGDYIDWVKNTLPYF